MCYDRCKRTAKAASASVSPTITTPRRDETGCGMLTEEALMCLVARLGHRERAQLAALLAALEERPQDVVFRDFPAFRAEPADALDQHARLGVDGAVLRRDERDERA